MHTFMIVIPLANFSGVGRDHFEDPICDLFDEDDGGELVGSGTFGNQEGAICWDIQVEVVQLSTMNRIVDILRQGGAPPDSIIKIIDEESDEVTETRLGDWIDIT